MATAGKPKLSLMSISIGKTRDKMGEEAEESPSFEGDYSADAHMAMEDFKSALQGDDTNEMLAAFKRIMDACGGM